MLQAIIKVQAAWRGYKLRKQLDALNQALIAQPEEGTFDEKIEEIDFFFNKKVKEVYDRLGPFKVPDLPGATH